MLVLLIACSKKDLSITDNAGLLTEEVATDIPNHGEPITNPYQKDNVKRAYDLINDPQILEQIPELNSLKEMVYFKFKPEFLNTENVERIEEHPTLLLLNFPVADGNYYPIEDCNMTETESTSEIGYIGEKDSPTMGVPKNEDNFVWGVFPIEDPLLNMLSANNEINFTVLDYLYDVPEDNLRLQWAVLKQSGHTCLSLNEFLVANGEIPGGNTESLFRTLRGRVTYFDRERTGAANQNVPTNRLQVWALLFGIPVKTYANANGEYTVPGRWLIGTIMGTKAKNSRVNIKPVDLSGTVAGIVFRLPVQFILGSVNIHGWVGRPAMRNNVNIHYGTYTQRRYWSQLLNTTNLHDQYNTNDRILNAPNNLHVYAVWGNRNGAGSAPMLTNISSTNIIVEFFLNRIFDFNVTVQFPRLGNLLKGFLPDVTMHINSSDARPDADGSQSTFITYTYFHELGHAQFFRKVGSLYYSEIIANTLASVVSNCGDDYGCSNALYAGQVQLNEAWAEFIGTDHALRLHPNGFKFSSELGGFARYSDAREFERWFADPWINHGIFNDLIDVANSNTDENTDDRIGGSNINELYNVFAPNIKSLCNYRDRFLQLYPRFNVNDVNDIYRYNGIITCQQ